MNRLLHQAEALISVIKIKLVGRKITGVVQSQDKSSVGFSLDDGTAVWVDRDQEGNGVGWLSAQG
jgi:hypothetical protein